MSSTFVLPGLPEYGASDLKRVYQKNVMRAFIVADVFVLLAVGMYWSSVYLAKEEPPARVIKIMKYTDLGPPPSIAGSSSVAPAVSVAGPVAKPSVGIPVPVPDAEITPDQTFASQTELSQNVGPVVGEGTGGGSVQIEQDVNIQIDDGPPPDFVPFEQAPTVIKRVEPIYPEIARKVNLEGKVIAYLWVDKKGKVRDVKIFKSDSEIFNQSVIDAAKQYMFTPAMMKNGPVSVWIAVPFTFQLK
jgi:TonB family protein